MRTNGTSLAPPGAEGKQGAGMVRPDPEVLAKPKRRRFSAAYKLRVLAEAEQCSKPGELGRLLRREGLYSSHLAAWRKAAHNGSLAALSKKRGRKPVTAVSKRAKGTIRKLERENARLREELRKARIVIDVQGKVAGLLGLSLERGKNS